MKIAWITGGKGFIGRNLAKHLASQGYSVFGIGHGFWPPKDYKEWLYSAWLNAEINFSNLNQLLAETGAPDVIFHLAGGSAVGPSIQNPYEDFKRTVETTARLLEWVRQTSVESRIIGVSSAAVYGAGFSCPIEETSAATPYSPYGFHKHMLEALFLSYKQSYDLNLAVIRLFSVYGEGLKKQLFWDICNKFQAASNRQIVLNGTGKEIRDWIHVNDAVQLISALGSAQIDDIIINGGTGTGTSINKVAEKFVASWGDKFSVEFSKIARKGDPQYLVADTHLLNALAFKPQIALDKGIKDYITWFSGEHNA